MSFWTAVQTCFTKYFDFKGRASRPEYWWFFLSFFVAYFGAGFVGGAIDENLGGGLMSIVIGGYIIPLLAAAVRRLHDTDRSGWYYLVGLIPFIGGIILIVMLATVGNVGVNKYGPPPGERSVRTPPAMASGALPPAPPTPNRPDGM